jgi:hypothetical protein
MTSDRNGMGIWSVAGSGTGDQRASSMPRQGAISSWTRPHSRSVPDVENIVHIDPRHIAQILVL